MVSGTSIMLAESNHARHQSRILCFSVPFVSAQGDASGFQVGQEACLLTIEKSKSHNNRELPCNNFSAPCGNQDYKDRCYTVKPNATLQHL